MIYNDISVLSSNTPFLKEYINILGNMLICFFCLKLDEKIDITVMFVR